MQFRRLLLIATLSVGSASAFAAPFSWISWDPWVSGPTATGTINTSNGPIGVTLTGGFNSILTGSLSHPNPTWTPTATWADGTIVDNGPTQNMVKMISAATMTITFSQSVSDLAFSVWSVGRVGNAVTYSFDKTLSLVSGGASTEWGGGSITTPTATSLVGAEGNGTVLFAAPMTTLTVVTNPAEDFHGFNLGLKTAQPVPEPFTMALGAAALALAARRRRAKQA